MFVRALISTFNRKDVPYCLVGGVAVALHGVPRMTYDIDIVVPMTAIAMRGCREALEGLGLLPRVPVALESLADPAVRDAQLREKNLVAVTFSDPSHPLREVDVLVSPPISPDELVARSVIRDADGLVVRVVCLDDLVAMKRAAGRSQDLADVAHLERLSRRGLAR
ncbi:MAG: nucleotidyl transferase AbiEii/AbiGii toxin family protein [Polyangiaceae bacterium]|nr:nucleotidyl transferase AbiEii/AbiGii toxin family protein [Polyangiaceae bacterium]